MQSTPSLRILIVDDDPIARALLGEHLTSSGHRVVAVASASEAIGVMEREPVRIVIADWLMPELSGLELLRWVRTSAARPQPHFVMLTANTGRAQLVEAFGAGVDDFLSKPLNDFELLARLKAWTRLSGQQTEASELARELLVTNRQLEEIAGCDELTGLANRRSSARQLNECIGLARGHEVPLACAAIDLDHFKTYNDTHGHAVGDEVLRFFAETLRLSTRNTDLCCRVGGDEFLVILPYTPLGSASSWAHKFTDMLARTPFCRGNVTITLRASIGLAAWREAMTREEILEAADRALYEAKNAGRGVVRAWEDPERRARAAS